MDFKDAYPEYRTVADYVRHAQAERSVVVAHLFAEGVARAYGGLRRIAAWLDAPGAAERDRSAIEQDLFLKRSVPRA